MSDKNEKIDLAALTDFYDWNRSGMKLVAYAGMRLTPDITIAVIDLFFPKFISYQGTILFENRFSEATFERWYEHYGGNLTDVEKLLNTTSVRDISQSFEGHLFQNIQYIGEVLKKSYTNELSAQFPERNIEIIGYRREDADDYIIAFWQIRQQE